MSLNVAVSALVARRRGENDREGANRVLAQAVTLTLAFTLVITVLAVAFAGPILRLAGSNEETHGSAVAYFRIISAAWSSTCSPWSSTPRSAARGTPKSP